jgi:dTDP-4-amino-4,6-dideoxygalactose transaminase
LADRLRQCSALRVPLPPDEIFHSYYKFYAFVRPESLRESWSRDRILAELAAVGVPCGSGICPEVYLETAFVELQPEITPRLPTARDLGETSLMWPVHPTLEDAHIERIADATIDVLSRAMR